MCLKIMKFARTYLRTPRLDPLWSSKSRTAQSECLKDGCWSHTRAWASGTWSTRCSLFAAKIGENITNWRGSWWAGFEPPSASTTVPQHHFERVHHYCAHSPYLKLNLQRSNMGALWQNPHDIQERKTLLYALRTSAKSAGDAHWPAHSPPASRAGYARVSSSAWRHRTWSPCAGRWWWDWRSDWGTLSSCPAAPAWRSPSYSDLCRDHNHCIKVWLCAITVILLKQPHNGFTVHV